MIVRQRDQNPFYASLNTIVWPTAMEQAINLSQGNHGRLTRRVGPWTSPSARAWPYATHARWHWKQIMRIFIPSQQAMVCVYKYSVVTMYWSWDFEGQSNPLSRLEAHMSVDVYNVFDDCIEDVCSSSSSDRAFWHLASSPLCSY